MRRRPQLAGLFLLPVVFATACGQPGEDTGTSLFIPLPRDFLAYKQWTRFDLGVSPDLGLPDGGTVDAGATDGGTNGSVHLSGHRVIYINQVPPPGSTEFPPGTILVKTIDEEAAQPGEIFAMAKRGGTYNMRGAAGWEWFELATSKQGTPLLAWRGITPPVGEGYAGAISGGACNGCHAVFSGNDSVADEQLALSRF